MQKKNTGTSRWVNGLDTLRFFLALIVMLSHLPTPWAATMKTSSVRLIRAVGELLPNVFCGVGAVIAFFIISGFVIHYPNAGGVKNVKKFLVRRWLRIGLPLLAISLIGIQTDAFFQIPIWSLYCELVYYTLYPLLAKIKGSWKQKMAVSFIFSLILITILGWNDIQSLIHQQNIHYSGAYWQTGDFITWIIGLPCWLMGVVLAQQYSSLKERPVSGLTIGLLRLAVICAGVFLDIGKFHFYLSYLVSMNFFCILLFFWIRAEIIWYMSRSSPRLLEYTGKFSYSIYLCHGVFLAMLEKRIVITNTNYVPVILLILLLSFFFYLIVERPSHLIAQKAAALLDSGNARSKELLPGPVRQKGAAGSER